MANMGRQHRERLQKVFLFWAELARWVALLKVSHPS